MTEEIKKDDIVVEETSAVAEEKVEEVKEETSKVEEKVEVAEKKEEVEVPTEFKKIVETIEKLSVMELNQLVKVFEEKFGVSATALAAGPANGGKDGGVDTEEKTEFDVELTDAGPSKIGVIKAIKNALGLGLKEAKDMAEGAPIIIKAGAKKDEAEEFKKALEEVGSKVTLK